MARKSDIIRAVEDLLKPTPIDWEILRKKNHNKVYFRGKMVAAFPATPSDHRGIKNTIAQVRRVIKIEMETVHGVLP